VKSIHQINSDTNKLLKDITDGASSVTKFMDGKVKKSHKTYKNDLRK
jgi:hypothetical protein